jgi:cysteinyl-tRNA synthetase
MSLMIHNTLTDRKEEFVPLKAGEVKMYVCGVTVYDDIHMGHARSIIVFDMVNRYLRYRGYKVTFVTNFTDVDDKIINRANERGIDPLQLSKEYIDRYFQDIQSLGVRKADIYPQASTSMPYIIQMVKDIVDRGYGYAAPDGSVYFRVRKMPDYGKLSNRTIDELRSSGRLDADPNKEDPLDFAIWKGAKPGEISWDSPWGKGRPGWHIECSAMIGHYLGDVIDIHGGGNDLVFPHHENEIMQTEAVTGGPLARYWMHNGMLQVKGEKMSKSLGNFFRVRDVAQKYDPQTIRFFFLNTHYMSPLVYGEDMVEEASVALKRLWNNYRELQSYLRTASGGDDAKGLVESSRNEFVANMDDDFNTREAIKVLFNIARTTNRMIGEKTLSKKGTEDILALMKEFDGVLGVLPSDDDKKDESLDSVMQILIQVRTELRKRKAYDLADKIRDDLTAAGIQLEDTADGIKWKRI